MIRIFSLMAGCGEKTSAALKKIMFALRLKTLTISVGVRNYNDCVVLFISNKCNSRFLSGGVKRASNRG